MRFSMRTSGSRGFPARLVCHAGRATWEQELNLEGVPRVWIRSHPANHAIPRNWLRNPTTYFHTR
jgi:hypothetical protein